MNISKQLAHLKKGDVVEITLLTSKFLGIYDSYQGLSSHKENLVHFLAISINGKIEVCDPEDKRWFKSIKLADPKDKEEFLRKLKEERNLTYDSEMHKLYNQSSGMYVGDVVYKVSMRYPFQVSKVTFQGVIYDALGDRFFKDEVEASNFSKRVCKAIDDLVADL